VRLAYYSLAGFSYDSREYQWIQSIRSLRRHNQSIPVWLFLFNGASNALLAEAERWDVHVCNLGDYAAFLQRAHPLGATLALYPTFHKFLVLPHLPLQKATQILYLDCDTFFFDDVDLLFDLHAEKDWYAREEFMSRRSLLGYDPNHVNEELLESIARREGLYSIPPFNSGVCVLNHGIWHSLARLSDAYLGLAWRLLCGREINKPAETFRDPQVWKAVMDAATDRDRVRALAYPSTNDWIIEQIALWLALGRLPHFSLGALSPTQVLQGQEFEMMLKANRPCVLAHYFTGMERSFFASVPAIPA
jgi:hypothetical protein